MELNENRLNTKWELLEVDHCNLQVLELEVQYCKYRTKYSILMYKLQAILRRQIEEEVNRTKFSNYLMMGCNISGFQG